MHNIHFVRRGGTTKQTEDTRGRGVSKVIRGMEVK